MNQPERQEKVLEYQYLTNQLQQLQNQLATLEQHTSQLQQLHTALTKLADINDTRDTFIPLGSGIFLKGTITNTQEVLMNVGANVCVKKPTTEALTTIEKQLDEVQQVAQHFETEMQKGISRIEELRKELSKHNAPST